MTYLDFQPDCEFLRAASDAAATITRLLTESGHAIRSTIEYTAVVMATPTASERIAKGVKRGVAPSRLSASLMSRPTAVEGSTPGYRRREFEVWIHRDGNAAALVAIEVELPADRSRPDAGLVTLSGLIGGGNRVLHIRAINC